MDRRTHRQISVSYRLDTTAQSSDRLCDRPSEFQKAPRCKTKHNKSQQQHKRNLNIEPLHHLALQNIQTGRFIVQISVHVFLYQLRQHINIIFQLHLPVIVIVCRLDQIDLALQIPAQFQHTVDCLIALFLRRRIQQTLCQILRRAHFIDRKSFRIMALHHIVVHFQINVRLKILIELGCRRHIMQDTGILSDIGNQHGKNDCHHCQNRHEKGNHQLSQTAL